MSKFDYKSSGVDVDLGDEASKILYEASKKTWENRKGKIGEIVAPFDDFSGVRVVDVSKLPADSVMCLGFDGVGTKIEIAERTMKHETVAYDLFAMVCDDAVVRGGEPVLMGSILDLNALEADNKSHIDFIRQLADGYVKAAADAGVAVINGEMAELGARIGGFGAFHYNWGSGLVWFARKDRLFTGNEINAGDQVVALKEHGFRSNGLSLARNILESKYGSDWHSEGTLAAELLAPSIIYSKAICKLTGGFADEASAEIHGVVHITGGGIPGKLGRALKASGLGAKLDNLYDPCELMQKLQKLGNVTDADAFQAWNMGQGMFVITPEGDKVVELLKKEGIESQVAGRVTGEDGIVIEKDNHSLLL